MIDIVQNYYEILNDGKKSENSLWEIISSRSDYLDFIKYSYKHYNLSEKERIWVSLCISRHTMYYFLQGISKDPSVLASQYEEGALFITQIKELVEATYQLFYHKNIFKGDLINKFIIFTEKIKKVEEISNTK